MAQFGDTTVQALRDVLGRTARRTTVVTSNLANVDTPGYRARDISFEQTLRSAGGLEPYATHPRHLTPARDSRLRGVVREAPIQRIRNDGNSVDVDREMTLLSLLQGRYRAATQMVRKRFAMLVYAATDGRNR